MYEIDKLGAIGSDRWFKNMFRPLDMIGRGFNGCFSRKDDNFVGEFDVPGFGEGDIEISVDDRIMSLSGKKENRTLDYATTIPDNVDVSQAVATVKDGVLKVTFPIAESAKSRQIQVKAE